MRKRRKSVDKEKIKEGRTKRNKIMQEKIRNRFCKVVLKLKKASEKLELSMLDDYFSKALLRFFHGK